MNRYFIIDLNDPNLEQIESCAFGDIDNARPATEADHVWIKLPTGDNEDHACLINYVEYTHAEMTAILKLENADEFQ